MTLRQIAFALASTAFIALVVGWPIWGWFVGG